MPVLREPLFRRVRQRHETKHETRQSFIYHVFRFIPLLCFMCVLGFVVRCRTFTFSAVHLTTFWYALLRMCEEMKGTFVPYFFVFFYLANECVYWIVGFVLTSLLLNAFTAPFL